MLYEIFKDPYRRNFNGSTQEIVKKVGQLLKNGKNKTEIAKDLGNEISVAYDGQDNLNDIMSEKQGLRDLLNAGIIDKSEFNDRMKDLRKRL